MPLNKIKISQQDLDTFYEIDKPIEKSDDTIKDKDEEGTNKEDTIPEFLTEEEQIYDDKLKETLNWDEEIKE